MFDIENDIECMKGWESLYMPIIEKINEHNQQHPDNPIEIAQIKEKFGGLRFYADNTTKEIDDMIDNAENESYYTCEICGSKEETGTCVINGWLSTVCKKCLLEKIKNYPRDIKKGFFKTKMDKYIIEGRALKKQ